MRTLPTYAYHTNARDMSNGTNSCDYYNFAGVNLLQDLKLQTISRFVLTTIVFMAMRSPYLINTPKLCYIAVFSVVKEPSFTWDL